MTLPNALCDTNRVRKNVRAFILGAEATERAIRLAQRICAECPVIEKCAEQALTGGSHMKMDVIAPADGVVQAGVVCRGDQETAEALSKIAGVPIPEYRTQIPRNRPGKTCASCKRPMVSWQRDKTNIPEGHQEHYARGYCTDCRSAYKKVLDSAPRENRGLRKPINRRRHHFVDGVKVEPSWL